MSLDLGAITSLIIIVRLLPMSSLVDKGLKSGPPWCGLNLNLSAYTVQQLMRGWG